MKEETKERLKTVAKIIVLILISIIAALLSEVYHGRAQVIADQTDKGFILVTGDKPLGGVSLIRQKVIDQGGILPEKEDIELLAEVMYHENWHTDPEHLAAYYTGAVVMNRVKSSRWPNTVKGVLYQKGQYATTGKFYTKALPEECYEMAKHILIYGTPDVPENVTFQAMRKQGKGVWKVVNTDYFCFE